MINIDDLTLGQIKQIQALTQGAVASTPPTSGSPNFSKVHGKYVIARTRNAGVIFGRVVEADYGYLHLVEARRLWRLISKDKSQSWYEGVATSGLDEESKVSSESDRHIVEDYEIVICSETAVASIKGFKTNETSI